MPKQTYIVTVETADPNADLDQGMRNMVDVMAEAMEEVGDFPMTIEVTDAEGDHVAGHEYDPED
jgi:hypothetical protein